MFRNVRRASASPGTPTTPAQAADPTRRMPGGPLPDIGADRVLLLTRAGCHLCDEARPAVESTCAQAHVGLRVIDVDACAPEVRAAWTDHVPVTVVDGRVVSIWFADPSRLADALQASPAGGPAHHSAVSHDPRAEGDRP